MTNDRAFTLLEIIVATVVLTASVVTIFAAVGSLSGRKPEVQSQLVPSGYAQRFMDSFRSQVDQAQWGNTSSLLYPDGNNTIPTSFFAGNSGYSGWYFVSTDASGARRVTVSVSGP